MLIVAAYDVDVTAEDGAKRLRRVAKICEKWGMRVQNSVFELLVDQSEFIKLKAALEKTIDRDKDSIRFYRIGNNYEGRITQIGRSPRVEQGKELIL